MKQAHQVFSLSEAKGVLVIAPHGDTISYRDSDVAEAVNMALDRINKLGDPRVVVDFSGAPYFGSVMIGAVSQFAERVRLLGGAFAVCEASPDMHQVLSAMKLNERWPIFENQRAAVKFAGRCET